MVIKADLLIKALLKKTKKAKKIISKFIRLPQKEKKDPLVRMAYKLASLHKPTPSDYRLKFCLDKSPDPPPNDMCSPKYQSPGDFSI